MAVNKKIITKLNDEMLLKFKKVLELLTPLLDNLSRIIGKQYTDAASKNIPDKDTKININKSDKFLYSLMWI